MIARGPVFVGRVRFKVFASDLRGKNIFVQRGSGGESARKDPGQRRRPRESLYIFFYYYTFVDWLNF